MAHGKASSVLGWCLERKRRGKLGTRGCAASLQEEIAIGGVIQGGGGDRGTVQTGSGDAGGARQIGRVVVHGLADLAAGLINVMVRRANAKPAQEQGQGKERGQEEARPEEAHTEGNLSRRPEVPPPG